MLMANGCTRIAERAPRVSNVIQVKAIDLLHPEYDLLRRDRLDGLQWKSATNDESHGVSTHLHAS
jgi:hypothetical protein